MTCFFFLLRFLQDPKFCQGDIMRKKLLVWLGHAPWNDVGFDSWKEVSMLFPGLRMRKILRSSLFYSVSGVFPVLVQLWTDTMKTRHSNMFTFTCPQISLVGNTNPIPLRNILISYVHLTSIARPIGNIKCQTEFTLSCRTKKKDVYSEKENRLEFDKRKKWNI